MIHKNATGPIHPRGKIENKAMISLNKNFYYNYKYKC